MNVIRLVSITVLSFLFSNVSAQETLTLWHSFSGSLGLQFKQIAERFNQSQPDFKVKLVYKGNYIESLTSFAAAYHAGHPPDMVQVFEVGRDAMFSARKGLLPVADLLDSEAIARLLPAVREYYSFNQVLMAYPLNVSVPVMYYNKAALAKVTPDQPFPTTWQEFDSLLVKLKKEGYGCGYTTAFPSWLHFESFASLHGLSLISPENPKRVHYQQPAVVEHIHRLKRWQENRLFRYGGRDSDATHLFTSQLCVIFSQSSGSWQSLQTMSSFPVGIAPIPIDNHISDTRHANTFGGAALWVVQQKSEVKRTGIRAWLAYLAEPKTQWGWYQNTGYLPMLNIEKLSYKSELLKIAANDLIRSKLAKPITWGPQNQLRIILDQALEALFSQAESVTSALSYAEEQANYRLLRFDKNYRV